MTGPLDDEPMQVPAVRLDQPAEVDVLRAELDRARAELAERPAGPPVARRVNQVGLWRTVREDAAQPLRTAATEERRTAAADLVIALRALGALGLSVLAAATLLVLLTVLYGLWRLAARFAAWSTDGSVLVGSLVMVVVLPVLVLGGAWAFLRATGRRGGDL